MGMLDCQSCSQFEWRVILQRPYFPTVEKMQDAFRMRKVPELYFITKWQHRET